MKYIHYYASKSQKYVFFSMAPRFTPDESLNKINVSGKAEAKRIAKENNLQPWNF